MVSYLNTQKIVEIVATKSHFKARP